MLTESCNMLSIKYVAMQNPPSYSQWRPAPVSSKQDSVRAGPEKSVLDKHKVGFSYMLMQSYNMLSIENVAV